MSDPRGSNSPQLILFGGAAAKPTKIPAYQADSETSKAAAIRIAPKVERYRDEILSCIRDAGEAGCTRKELEALTGIQTQTITPRICELKEAGEIRPLTYFDMKTRKIVTVKRESCEVLVIARSAA